MAIVIDLRNMTAITGIWKFSEHEMRTIPERSRASSERFSWVMRQLRFRMDIRGEQDSTEEWSLDHSSENVRDEDRLVIGFIRCS